MGNLLYLDDNGDKRYFFQRAYEDKYIIKPIGIEKLDTVLEQAYQVNFSKNNKKPISQTIPQEREIRSKQHARTPHEDSAQNIANVNLRLKALQLENNIYEQQ
jgi:sulfite reductase beta subunit-like hemoprotein